MTGDGKLLGLERAVEAAGGVVALTKALGCSRTVVSNWRREGGIPASRVPSIAKLTGLSPQVLRPDLFPDVRSEEPSHPGLAESQAPFAAEAQALGLDAAAIAAQAVQDAIRAEKARRWLAENADAIEAWNRWTESNELPLAEYRTF
jgi:post-segregation antitoxin (ccd killing protein)/DNA-binding transcriptional regulator YdaS (Cro superfamily)